MRPETRLIFNNYMQQLSQLNGGVDVATKFAAVPSVEQALEKHIQESSAFLQMVNSYGVDQQKGDKVGMSVASTIAGRTDTTGADRATADVHDTDSRTYDCAQTNFDTHLRYATLDAWAKFPEFQTLLRDMILRQQALDRIMIGWNGTSAAATTDRGANPLLQDVNIGWLTKLQTEAAARYMTQGAVADEVRVGADAGNDYANFDELVFDMRRNLLGAWHTQDNSFHVMTTGDLVDEKYFPLIKTHADQPTEARALDLMLSNRRMGGLQVAEVPYFPSRTLFITKLGNSNDSNLSIYHQDGTRRRHIEDNPKRDRVENYESVNEAYVIEDLTASCAVVNIKLWNGAAWA